MTVLVVLAHPATNSFNTSIAQAAMRALRDEGHQVIFHDLYNDGFDPVTTKNEMLGIETEDALTQRYCKDLEQADGYIIVHPNWWGQPPAILKGWIDRVIRPGIAYIFADDDEGGIPTGLLKNRIATVFTTSNTAEEREKSVFKDPLDTLWKNCIFGFCGLDDVHRTNYQIVCLSSQEQIHLWLDDVYQTVKARYPKSGA